MTGFPIIAKLQSLPASSPIVAARSRSSPASITRRRPYALEVNRRSALFRCAGRRKHTLAKGARSVIREALNKLLPDPSELGGIEADASDKYLDSLMPVRNATDASLSSL